MTLCRICGQPAAFASDQAGPLCIQHAEANGATARPLRPGEGPSASAGMVTGNVRGVNQDGKRTEGATSWEYRPPRPAPDLHHDQHIVIGNELQFQQSPPVHVNGTPPKRATGGSRGAARVEAKEQIEQAIEAAGLTEQEREVYRLRRVLGYRRPEIADMLKMTLTAVKKALERATGKVRRDTVQF